MAGRENISVKKVSCVGARPQSGEEQLLSQRRSRRLPLCPASAPAPRVERNSCSAKEEVDSSLVSCVGARPQSVAQPRKSTPSFVSCVGARPQSGEEQLLSQRRSRRLPLCPASAPAPRVDRNSCSAKEEVDSFLCVQRQRPPPEWRGTVAQPTKKSTPSFVSCVGARPQSGEEQLLSQGRSRLLPLCPASAPAPRVERNSCSAKEEVDSFLGVLRRRPPPEWRGTVAQPRKKSSFCVLRQRPPPGTVAQPRKKSSPSLVSCVGARPQSGEEQLLSQGRSRLLPWCPASAPAPRVERNSCSAKEEAHIKHPTSITCTPSFRFDACVQYGS